MNTKLERLTSLKAGIIGAITFTLASLSTVLFDYFLEQPLIFDNNFSLKILSYLGTGFLFSVTYLHLISNNSNSHLKDGAVLAFGLVRGFAGVEIVDNISNNLGILTIIGLESLISFALTRFCLDLAIKYRLISLL